MTNVNETTVPTLSNGPITVRPATDGDIAARIALGVTPEIVHMFGGSSGAAQSIDEETATGWVKNLQNQPFGWVICFEERVIGNLFFHTYWRSENRCSVAIGILDPTLLGQGIGTKALHLALSFGFETLALHRVELRVLEYNTRAIASYKKLGFVEEGRARQAALVDGTRYDDVIMGLLAGELSGELKGLDP